VRTIALVSQKGGSGKSSIAVHLAVAALRKKRSVMLLDLDPQASVMAWAKRRGEDDMAIASARSQEVPGLLSRAREQGADLAILDTPGRASIDAARVIGLADVVLVPCRVGVYDVEASVETAAEVQRSGVKRAAFVLNAVPTRGTRHEEARVALAALLPVCPVELHHRVAYGDALNDGRSVEEMDPKGAAAGEIRALFQWVTKL
jgi:chromosome partitioning protein